MNPINRVSFGRQVKKTRPVGGRERVGEARGVNFKVRGSEADAVAPLTARCHRGQEGKNVVAKRGRAKIGGGLNRRRAVGRLVGEGLVTKGEGLRRDSRALYGKRAVRLAAVAPDLVGVVALLGRLHYAISAVFVVVSLAAGH